MNNKPVEFYVDTGADITAISAKTCERIKAVVNKDSTVARLANGRLQSASTTNVKIDLMKLSTLKLWFWTIYHENVYSETTF